MEDININMPSLGADMDDGIITAWKISPTDYIQKGQIIAEVETPKSIIEIESFETGRVKTLLVEEGKKVKVGTPIAILESIEKVENFKKHRKPVRLSPRAKRLMAESKKKESTTQIQKNSEDRQRIIGRLMQKSITTIPHFYLEKEMKIKNMLSWIHKANEKRTMQERYLPAVVFIKVLALALKKYPKFNGKFIDDKFHPESRINIGVIISLREGGLIAPSLESVNEKTLDQLMQDFRDLVNRARAGKVKNFEMENSTICFTNLGDQGADKVYGIIYPPQVAILGTGKINLECQTCHWTISADHRVLDGHQGSLLLNTIQRLLEKPQAWE